MTAGYHTLRELQEQAVLQNREVWEIVRNADMSENERSAEASFEKMTIMYQAMKQADQSYNGALRSASGRAGGDGAKLQQYNAQGKNICGDFIGKVMEKAIKMGESIIGGSFRWMSGGDRISECYGSRCTGKSSGRGCRDDHACGGTGSEKYAGTGL